VLAVPPPGRTAPVTALYQSLRATASAYEALGLAASDGLASSDGLADAPADGALGAACPVAAGGALFMSTGPRGQQRAGWETCEPGRRRCQSTRGEEIDRAIRWQTARSARPKAREGGGSGTPERAVIQKVLREESQPQPGRPTKHLASATRRRLARLVLERLVVSDVVDAASEVVPGIA
jgi:hypothetical protein